MIRAAIVCSLLAVGLASVATSCQEEIPSEQGLSPAAPAQNELLDGGSPVDAATPAQCCPISEQPACGMHLGGTRGEVSCDMTFSGIAQPDDRWLVLADENGCPRWYEPEWLTPWACCGCPTPPDAAACFDVIKDVPTLPEAERICLDQNSCNICVQTRDAQSDFDVISYYITPFSDCGCFIKAEIYGDAG
jgi:hypothetical protein